MTKKEIENDIRECIMCILDKWDEYFDSYYKNISNFLKYKYGVTIKNQTIYCYEPIATILDELLGKICTIQYEIEIIKDGYNYWNYYGKY